MTKIEAMQVLSIANPFGGPVEYYEELSSTMDQAKKEPSDGKVIVTGLQTRGRGRVRGRTWNSEAGQSLLTTLCIDIQKLQIPLTSASIRSALALGRLLRKNFTLSPEIKWPNDVLVEGKKIAGILCESSSSSLFIGIGLNCRQPSFPSDLRRPATSIFQQTGWSSEPFNLLTPLLEELRIVLFDLAAEQLPALANPFLYNIEKEIELREGDPSRGPLVRGVNKGIGIYGELQVLEKSGKIHTIYSGE